jgi:iron complex outermembrane receptor protein
MHISKISRPKKTTISLLALSIAVSLPVISQETENQNEAGNLEIISVEGRRVSSAAVAIGLDEVTNTVAVTRAELLSAPAGISGLKMLESLPGFNVQTDGALGLYEFGNSVNVRAFNLRQIGFVLDGIPMGRSDAFGGSPIFRYVDNENLGSVVASPGAGDVSAPSYSSLGPIASYYTVKPSSEMSGIVSVTMGDDNLERSFVKLETGDMDGFSAYVSRSKTDSELWRGPGTIDREHIEAKAYYQLENSGFIQATYVSNDFFDYDSPSGTKATFDANYNYGYSPNIPDSCINPLPQVADFNQDGVITDSDFTPVFTDSSCTSYFEDRVNIRDDKLFSLSGRTFVGEAITLDGSYYHEDKAGYGVSPDSYSNSKSIYVRQIAAGLDVVHPRGVQYGLSTVGGDREGVTSQISLELDTHVISVGGWIEKDTYNRTQQRLNKTAGSADGQVIEGETVYLRRNYQAVRDTTQIYVKDNFSLMDDRLALELGFKSLNLDYSLKGYRDYADYEINSEPGYGPQSTDAEYSKNFLPMIGAVYTLNSSDQLFASFAQNFALPAGADEIFDNAVGFDAQQPDGEESQNVEVGIRTSRANFNASLAVYFTEFDNRLFQSSVLNPATNQPESFYINGGSSEAYGFELSGVYQPEALSQEVYLNLNLAYKHAELVDGFGTNPAGSQLADSPEWLFTGGITYEPSEWLVANISAKYTGERFTDYAEKIAMDDYWVVSTYLDIGGANGFAMPENMSLRFNIDNLFDKKVLSFAFTNSPFFRPLSPRTFQASLTVRF